MRAQPWDADASHPRVVAERRRTSLRVKEEMSGSQADATAGLPLAVTGDFVGTSVRTPEAEIKGCGVSSDRESRLLSKLRTPQSCRRFGGVGLCAQTPRDHGMAILQENPILMPLTSNVLLPRMATPLGLPPRQQQVLFRLQSGNSEKEIAWALGISRHTVHVYVKLLYRSFGVRSRGELLSLWIRPVPTAIGPSEWRDHSGDRDYDLDRHTYMTGC